MNKEDDFSVEDDKETVTYFENTAANEFKRLTERLKREARLERLAYLRSLGKTKRRELKAKYGCHRPK